MTLAAAPARIIDERGQVAMGRFAGRTGPIDWAQLAPPLRRSAWWRHFHHKRWHYVALAGDELFCAVAIVDLGWTSTAFAYAFDRRVGKVVASLSQDGVPGLSARLADCVDGNSQFRFPGTRIDIRATGDGGHSLALRCRQFEIDASLRAGAPLLLAVGAVDGGAVHATQKSPGCALSGSVRIGARHASLDGGVASFDYSNGLLARDTSWRWACAHGPSLGFNLQAGYFGANENALWLDGELIALGAASFALRQDDPLAPWHIHTDDGLLDLHFQPEGARRQDRKLIVAASRYVQPIGTFSGLVKAHRDAPGRPVRALVGVTEEHQSRW